MSDNLPDLSPSAAEAGKRIARLIFKLRGNHSEVHLSELQLVAIVAFALDQSLELLSAVEQEART